MTKYLGFEWFWIYVQSLVESRILNKFISTGCPNKKHGNWNTTWISSLKRQLAFQNVSFKLTETFNIWIVLFIFKKLESGQISYYLRQFGREKMVDHILEILRLLVFGVKCFNCDTTKLYLRNNPAWRDRSRHLIPMFIGTPCIKKAFLKGKNETVHLVQK